MAKRPPEPEPAEAGLSRILELLSFLAVVVTFPVSLFFTLKTTKEYERVVIFRLGRSLGRARGPGLYFVLPCLDRCSVVDLRTRTHSVPRQEVYTLDGVTVHVSAVLTYRVVEARLAVTAVEDCHASTKLLATTVLRSEVGRRNLAVLLADRVGLAADIKEQFSETTPAWGVQVERLELRDLGIDPGLQRCMAVESTTYRQFQAASVNAAAEAKAGVALRAAGEELGGGGRQLRALTFSK